MKIKLALLSLVLVVSSACGGVGRNFDTERVQQIKNGTTTRAEIVEWFGKPFGQSTSTVNGKPVLQYSYQYAKATGFSPYTSKTLMVEFDENEVVKNHSFSTQGTASK